MARDSRAEKKPCPICWKGVLYNTGIRQKRAPHHFFYQCSFCGRAMTATKYGRIMEHMKRPGVPVRGKARRAAKAEKPKVIVPHPGFVVGVVRDAKTGKPIEMAHVCLRGRGIEAFTNRFGQYALEPVPEHREVEIEISSPGHAKKVHIYRYGIKGGEIRRLDVSLHPTRRVQKPASLKLAADAAGRLKATPILEFRRGMEIREISRSGIEGVVKDIQGKPIFAALVTIFHHERILIVQTDTMGHYELMNILPPGDYMVRAAAYGYSFDRRWIRIEKGRVLRCDFVLAEGKRAKAD
ncbi:MAG: carboxypeptidase regulatory-like domain-containing protein [Candidatus Aenigmarchaeota archaeon]|nr:carboxypeptidase regulatory-like domain-containing protein [Candidatus Aenigmarchaeota archaeon]